MPYMHSPQDHFIITLIITDVTEATLGASDLWLGTRIGAGGTAMLTKSFFYFFVFAQLYGQQVIILKVQRNKDPLFTFAPNRFSELKNTNFKN